MSPLNTRPATKSMAAAILVAVSEYIATEGTPPSEDLLVKTMGFPLNTLRALVSSGLLQDVRGTYRPHSNCTVRRASPEELERISQRKPSDGVGSRLVNVGRKA